MRKLENVRFDFGILLHVEKAWFGCISTYPYLTKRPSTHWDVFTTPPGTRNIETAKARECAIRFWRFLRVGKAWLGCISTYSYLVKRPSTHRDVFITLLGTRNIKTEKAREHAVRFRRSFARRKGLIWMYSHWSSMRQISQWDKHIFWAQILVKCLGLFLILFVNCLNIWIPTC